MCRSIKPLFNFEPPATKDEMHAAVLQFVRKISGFQRPSAANEAVFEGAVEDITRISLQLLSCLQTQAAPKDRQKEAAKAKARFSRRLAAGSRL